MQPARTFPLSNRRLLRQLIAALAIAHVGALSAPARADVPARADEPALAQSTGIAPSESDLAFIEEISQAQLQDLEERAGADRELLAAPGFKGALRKLSRSLAASKRFSMLQAKSLLSQPDIAIADVTFRVIRWTVVYPLLIQSGNTWMIPAFGNTIFAPTNLDAAYYTVRKWVQSQLIRRRLGNSGSSLQKLKDQVLGSSLSDHMRFHVKLIEGEAVLLVVRTRKVRDFLPKLRARYRAPGVALTSDLEALVADREFLYRAKDLKYDLNLYEEVLIEELLRDPRSRNRFVELVRSLQSDRPTSEWPAVAALLTDMGRARAFVGTELFLAATQAEKSLKELKKGLFRSRSLDEGAFKLKLIRRLKQEIKHRRAPLLETQEQLRDTELEILNDLMVSTVPRDEARIEEVRRIVAAAQEPRARLREFVAKLADTHSPEELDRLLTSPSPIECLRNAL